MNVHSEPLIQHSKGSRAASGLPSVHEENGPSVLSDSEWPQLSP